MPCYRITWNTRASALFGRVNDPLNVSAQRDTEKGPQASPFCVLHDRPAMLYKAGRSGAPDLPGFAGTVSGTD